MNDSVLGDTNDPLAEGERVVHLVNDFPYSSSARLVHVVALPPPPPHAGVTNDYK
jgi:hypothetical protein